MVALIGGGGPILITGYWVLSGLHSLNEDSSRATIS